MDTFIISKIKDILSHTDKITLDDIFRIYSWIGNDVDFMYLDHIKKNYKLSDEAFSEAVKLSYIQGKSLRRAYKYFINKKYSWIIVASNEEKEIYNSLPERLIIYRGTNKAEAIGYNFDLNFSWTLDRGIAEFFAFRHNLADRLVIEVEISKEEIKAIFNDRDEKEIICIMPKQEIKITTTRKTSYYNQYMQTK